MVNIGFSLIAQLTVIFNVIINQDNTLLLLLLLNWAENVMFTQENHS